MQLYVDKRPILVYLLIFIDVQYSGSLPAPVNQTQTRPSSRLRWKGVFLDISPNTFNVPFNNKKLGIIQYVDIIFDYKKMTKCVFSCTDKI